MINEAELQSLIERASNAPLDDKDNCFICYEAANVIVYLYAQLQQSNKTVDIEQGPNTCHESHKSVRSSDASTFDYICDDCGATDDVTGSWGTLRKPCKKRNEI